MVPYELIDVGKPIPCGTALAFGPCNSAFDSGGTQSRQRQTWPHTENVLLRKQSIRRAAFRGIGNVAADHAATSITISGSPGCGFGFGMHRAPSDLPRGPGNLAPHPQISTTASP